MSTAKQRRALKDLVELLSLERLETNLFRGESRDIGGKQVFGGQVLGQALAAASFTVEGRSAHSLHAYFLRRGDMHAPIVYEVDRQRDGRSFSNRRVMAIQHGRPILNLAASFQVEERGLEHAVAMPIVPLPEELSSRWSQTVKGSERMPEKTRRFLFEERPFEFRWVQQPEYQDASPGEPRRQLWLRAVEALPDDDNLHRAMLAYASDYGLLTTALLPHAVTLASPRLQIASLDHAMWFHRPLRLDRWLLYAYDSPMAGGGRGLSRGQIFDLDGRIVASAAQEGLIRIWSETRD